MTNINIQSNEVASAVIAEQNITVLGTVYNKRGNTSKEENLKVFDVAKEYGDVAILKSANDLASLSMELVYEQYSENPDIGYGVLLINTEQSPDLPLNKWGNVMRKHLCEYRLWICGKMELPVSNERTVSAEVPNNRVALFTLMSGFENFVGQVAGKNLGKLGCWKLAIITDNEQTQNAIHYCIEGLDKTKLYRLKSLATVLVDTKRLHYLKNNPDSIISIFETPSDAVGVVVERGSN